MTDERSAKGTRVVDMWDLPMPDPGKTAGFPVLKQAEHTTVYHATRESGGYSHHAQLTVHEGVLYAMWSNHPHGEDSPGQFVRFSYSRDGKTWAEPRRLFPPYGEIKPFEALGPFGAAQAGGWIVHEGELYGLMGILDTVGYANTDRSSTRPERDGAHRFRVKHFVGRVARSVSTDDDDDAMLGACFEVPADRGVGLDPEQPLTAALKPLEGERHDIAQGLAEALKARHPWRGGLKAVDTPRPVEPTYYRTADGTWVCLMRDDAYSHRMYVSISEDGEHWPAARPTNIPDSPSLSDTVALADGTVFLVGNQVAPRFDNSDEVGHYPRVPLTVSVSPDGYRFTHAYALQTQAPDHRVPLGRSGRGRGPQYPSALVHNGRLHVLYSMGKEDVWYSSVPLPHLLPWPRIEEAEERQTATPQGAVRNRRAFMLRMRSFPFLPTLRFSIRLAADTGAAWSLAPVEVDGVLTTEATAERIVSVGAPAPKQPLYPLPALQVEFWPEGEPQNTHSRLLPLPRPVGRAGLAVKRSTVTPRVDGTLDEKLWRATPDVPVLGRMDLTRSVEPVTQAWTAYDEDNLYLAFRCQEPETGKLKADAKQRDEKVYLDDSVEIMFDPAGDAKTYYQVIVNSKGVVFDGQTFNNKIDMKNLKAAASVQDDDWTAEIAIPWKDVGLDNPPENAGILLGRNRQAGGELEVFQFPLSPKGNHQPDHFARMVLDTREAPLRKGQEATE